MKNAAISGSVWVLTDQVGHLIEDIDTGFVQQEILKVQISLEDALFMQYGKAV